MAALGRAPRRLLPDMHMHASEDPLTRALRPPPDESLEQKTARVARQQEAQRVSKFIDERIQEDRKVFEKKKKAIKLLLLGQAESGKSTTLRNFQLVFAPKHFARERAVWKTIIQLNLIRSLNTILEVLQEEWDTYPPSAHRARSPPTSTVSRPSGSDSAALTDEHRRLRMRLSPLLSIEQALTRRLMPPVAESMAWTPSSPGSLNFGDHQAPRSPSLPKQRSQEVCVRAGGGWKSILSLGAVSPTDSTPPSTPSTSPVSLRESAQELSPVEPPAARRRRFSRPRTAGGVERDRDDPTMALAASREDIVQLWEDPVVRRVLRKWNVRMQDTSGFFLNDAARIADMNYEPTESDILRARVRTLGVEEHRFTMENGVEGKADWYVYDVGGSRQLRNAWIPYFDDVQAIIFLAPLAFNLVLEEDPSVNRLLDSIVLWKEICQNALLSKATLILFLNKRDVLDSTLRSGVKVVDYVPSYGDLPNDSAHVTRYFLERFITYHRRFSHRTRPLFCHETSVINAKATREILIEVKQGIFRKHLGDASMI